MSATRERWTLIGLFAVVGFALGANFTFWTSPPSPERGLNAPDDAPADAPREFRVEREVVSEDEAPEEGETEAQRLRATLERVLSRVVEGGELPEAELVQQVEDALDRDDIGDAERREDAAWGAVAAMLSAADEFEGTHIGAPAMRERAIRQQVTTLVRELYEAVGDVDAAARGTFGPRPDGYRRVPWDRLTEIDYEAGEPLPPRVRGLDGERVVMAGYFVRTAYGELLLVKSVWSCCFGQPPAVHEAVVVSLEAPPEDAWLDGLIRVAGTLEVGEERDEGYVVSVYRMRADRVDVLR